ncbi:D-alanyl-D-alanine carboxypeptidase family protein [Branchiibius sp. NY16-3462-2]|uniref:D-alanyl-D-alanine carboxypeptidase family protein n=1 Tax=Branchiibius sp. NY16-3462-2 TaxID=1807500 RepID=UPI00079A5050|nr:D-alanyl-D-alanine carboxypeptidase family protein [Branchiibius sp. NY16-3462-2]KYH45621.1 hypothetical protein AZH51_18040 [Branchiibius sp. NY16-3462-2]
MSRLAPGIHGPTRRPRLAIGVAASAIALGTAAPPAVAATPSAVSTTVVSMRVVSSVSTLNVRTGPGSAYARVGSLTGGSFVLGVVNGGWLKISSGQYAGRYTSAAYLAVARPAPTAAVGSTVTGWVALTGGIPASVHSAPGYIYSVGRTVPSGTAVTGKVINADWIRINGIGGYINRGTLQTLSANLTSVNGNLPAWALCRVNTAYNSPQPFDPGYTATTQRYLNCDAVRALDALQAAYKTTFGHYASIDLAYRTYSEQQYWYKTLGPKYANAPGVSNHGVGLAVDFQEWEGHTTEFDWGGAGSNWLRANGGKYGFTQPYAYGTAGESYHFNFTG